MDLYDLQSELYRRLGGSLPHPDPKVYLTREEAYDLCGKLNDIERIMRALSQLFYGMA